MPVLSIIQYNKSILKKPFRLFVYFSIFLHLAAGALYYYHKYSRWPSFFNKTQKPITVEGSLASFKESIDTPRQKGILKDRDVNKKSGVLKPSKKLQKQQTKQKTKPYSTTAALLEPKKQPTTPNEGSLTTQQETQPVATGDEISQATTQSLADEDNSSESENQETGPLLQKEELTEATTPATQPLLDESHLSEIEKKETESLSEEDEMEQEEEELPELETQPLPNESSLSEIEEEEMEEDEEKLPEATTNTEEPLPDSFLGKAQEIESEEKEEFSESETKQIESLPEKSQTQPKNPDSTDPTFQPDKSENEASLVFRNFLDLKQAPGNPPLNYPEKARKMKSEGSISLIFYVTKEGLVEKIQVESSSGHSQLDNSVMRTFARYRFSPEQSGWVRHTVHFVLKGEKIEFLKLRER